jgi:uncharacterized membrane protein
MKYVAAYAATLMAFVVVDLVWLGVVAKRFYQAQLDGLLAEKYNFGAAALFYLAYPLGVLFFAVVPAFASGSWLEAAVWGGFLGLFAYGTYDLTNLATLRNWPLRLTVIDVLWGTVLTAFAAACGQLAVNGIWH